MKKDSGTRFTISTGIAVAHYKQPLSMVLQQASEMVEMAKREGRDRWAMGVMKHSGGYLSTCFPWVFPTQDETLPARWVALEAMQHIWHETLTNFSTASLMRMAAKLEELDYRGPGNMILSLARLYYLRSLPTGTTAEPVDQLVSATATLLGSSDCPDARAQENLANALLLCDFLVRRSA